jgi:hypothetical protein
MDGFSEAQLSSCIPSTHQYNRRSRCLRLDNLPAETSRYELKQLLDVDYRATRRIVYAGSTAFVTFMNKKEVMDAII